MSSNPDFASVFITDELWSRLDRVPDYKREKETLRLLAGQMVAEPENVVSEFVRLAMELTGGSSSGLSVLEAERTPQVFRWNYLHGDLAQFEGATAPRDDSPCGNTLDQRRPVLCRHPERAYSWLADAGIEIAEALLVPLYVGGDEPYGTLWIIASDEKHFCPDHARVASELADLIGMALRLRDTERAMRIALEQQELLAHEMSHRVQNVFALVDSMIQLTSAGAKSAKDLAQSLSERLNALAKAHSLVSRDRGAVQESTDLATLIRAVVSPYDFAGSQSRFHIQGAEVPCGVQSAGALALVFHELATNAVKYGSLAHSGGRVSIHWTANEGDLRIIWEEEGGAAPSPPVRTGFGTNLIGRTVTGHFSGSVENLWCENGLLCTMRINIAGLAH